MTKRASLLNKIGEKVKDYKLDEIVDNMSVDELKEITELLKNLTDYRNNAGYKLLENSVMITFIGLLSDCNEWTEIYDFSKVHEEWFMKFLDLTYGLPSLSTLKRHISIIDSEELEYICVNYIIKKVSKLQESLNIEEDKNKKDIIKSDKREMLWCLI